VVVARLGAEFELSSAVGVHDAMLAALTNRDHGIVVDLQEVSFMDSAGINALFDMAERLHGRQQKVVIVLPERAVVRRVAELVGLGSTVGICETLDEAVAAVPPADPA